MPTESALSKPTCWNSYRASCSVCVCVCGCKPIFIVWGWQIGRHTIIPARCVALAERVVIPQYWPYKLPQPLCGAMKYLRLLEWRNNARTVIYSVVHPVHIVSRLFMCSGILAGRDYRLSVLQFCSYSLISTALWDMTHPVDVSGASEKTAVSIIRLHNANGGG